MSGLPLALEQAGTYIEDTGGSVSRYLELYEEYRARMLQERYGALANYPLLIATAWEMSKDAVRRETLPTAAFLQCCAFLDSEAIPEEIFLRGASALGPELATSVVDRLTINRVTAILRRYALLNREVRERERSPASRCTVSSRKCCATTWTKPHSAVGARCRADHPVCRVVSHPRPGHVLSGPDRKVADELS